MLAEVNAQKIAGNVAQASLPNVSHHHLLKGPNYLTPHVLEPCNSRSTLELLEFYGSQMEHWLQLMCCALAVILVSYFENVGGRLRKEER